MTPKHKKALAAGRKRAAAARKRRAVSPGTYKAQITDTSFDVLTGNVTMKLRLRGKGLGPGGREITQTTNVQAPLKVEKSTLGYEVTDELMKDDFANKSAPAVDLGQVLANHTGGVAVGRELLSVKRPVLDIDLQATDALKSLGDRFDVWQAAQKRFEETDPRDPQFLPYASQATVAFLMYSEAARRAQNVISPTVRA